MTYTIEKVTTLIGARRYGDNDTNIGFIRPIVVLFVSRRKLCSLHSSLSAMMVIITSTNCIAEV